MIYLIEMEGEIGEAGFDGYYVELDHQELVEVTAELDKAVADGHLTKYEIIDLNDRANDKKSFMELLDWTGLCEGHKKS